MLGSNALTTLQALKNLPVLRSLHAYGNQLQTLDLPPDSPALQNIEVSGNPIREMPAGFTYNGGENRAPSLTPISGKFTRIHISGTPLAKALAKGE